MIYNNPVANTALLQQITHTNPWMQSPQHNLPKPVRIRRLSKFELALIEATKKVRPIEIKVTDKYEFYFSAIGGEDLIETMGKLRPIHAGRPQRWMQMLLNSVPSPMIPGSKTASNYAARGSVAGLMYGLPHIIGKRRRRYRLSASGLMLLDYFAEKNPSFRPFHSAYVTNKARKEISSDCVNFTLGIVSSKIAKDIEANEIIEANKARAYILPSAASATVPMTAGDAYKTWLYTSRLNNSSFYSASGGTSSTSRTSVWGSISNILGGII